MSPPRLLSRLLLVLCLQFQALAALAMPCVHGSPERGAWSASGCHHPHPAPAADERPGGCAKCALAGVSASYPPAGGDTPEAHPRGPVLVTALPAHFYRHVPPPALRPPTPITS